VRRVLHVIGVMDLGGAETLIMNVYRHLDRKATQFDVVSLSLREGAYDAEIVELGGRIFRIPPPATAGLMATARSFRNVLREQGPFSAVHSHVQKFSGFIAWIAAKEGVPVRVVHSHTTRDMPNDRGWRRAYSWVMRMLIRKYGTARLGCSADACQALFGPRCLGDARTSVVHNGVDWKRFALESEQRGRTRRRLGIAPGAPLLCHVGNFVPAKNHGFLIAAFRQMARLGPGAHLLLVGDGPLRSEIVRLVSEWRMGECITILGRRRDIPALLGAADLFLFPSLYEGVPTALIEAQMTGLPCLASSRITPEVDLGIGLVSFLGLESGPERWAEEAVRLLGAQRHVPMEDRTRALSEAGYDIAAVAKQLENIYRAA
jgi:glycosyltransferase EpsF